jgi:hypothetical protein
VAFHQNEKTDSLAESQRNRLKITPTKVVFVVIILTAAQMKAETGETTHVDPEDGPVKR